MVMKNHIKMQGKRLWLCVSLSFACMLDAFSISIDITALGAKGDGVTDNTVCIQKAIDECAAQSGGTVIIPAGKFLTRTLFLKSDVNLHLQFGAELLGSTDLESYHEVFPVLKGKETPALIFARNACNIAITGLGTINGQGSHSNFQHGNDADGGPKRPKILYFIGCKNVRVQDVTLRNSAYWTQDYEKCDGVVVRGVKVYCHSNWNNDGLDIDSRNVVVSDCYIDCDDDALCLKSDTDTPCENVVVTNCVLKTNCNAIKFGTSSYSGFKNVSITNCVIDRASEDNIRQWYKNVPWLGTEQNTVVSGIALESVDGGVLENVIISDIAMRGVQTPIFVRLGDRKRTFTKQISRINDVMISRIMARSESKVACSITGVPGGKVRNLAISDVTLITDAEVDKREIKEEVPEVIEKYPENRMFGTILPASGFYVRHADGVTFSNVNVITEKQDERPMFYLDDVDGFLQQGCRLNGLKPTIKRVKK